MSEAFDILSGALTEAVQDVKKKNLTRHVRSINIEAVNGYNSQQIKNIRHKTGLTQNLLAKYMGVSTKTVEAWEAGRNKPSGPSCRLLWLLEMGKISL